jgi:Reverse transcriptase (RNA-dependent DNA polymerase)
VIALLPTLSKILERIVGQRLHEHARKNNMISRLQCGSLPGLSTTDAVVTLLHEVSLFQKARLKATSLFLDIKGGFDNVELPRLITLLRGKNTPTYITTWISSFLTGRSCK